MLRFAGLIPLVTPNDVSKSRQEARAIIAVIGEEINFDSFAVSNQCSDCAGSPESRRVGSLLSWMLALTVSRFSCSRSFLNDLARFEAFRLSLMVVIDILLLLSSVLINTPPKDYSNHA